MAVFFLPTSPYFTLFNPILSTSIFSNYILPLPQPTCHSSSVQLKSPHKETRESMDYKPVLMATAYRKIQFSTQRK